MKEKIIKILKIIKYPTKYNSEVFIRHLRKKGCLIGKGTYFFAPEKTYIDTKNGIFIKIGNYCKITKGVEILAHDYSYSVLRRVYHSIPKKASMTIIGNNVFIGINSIILSGSEIGDNVIIGAGSVVSGKIPSNEVWGGNPVRFICTLEDYYNKCQRNFEKGAILTIKQYNERLKRNPNIQELQYFSTLFLDNSENSKHEYLKMSFSGDDKNEVLDDLLKNKRKYNSLNELIKSNRIKGE